MSATCTEIFLLIYYFSNCTLIYSHPHIYFDYAREVSLDANDLHYQYHLDTQL